MQRKIRLIKSPSPVVEGAGVHLQRVFGYHDTPHFDPFLMLDDFRNDDPRDYLPGFPWHPHRGIETITYMLEGSAEHKDSIGNSGTIGKGDVQWMTAGSGIIHQEMPKPDAKGRMYGFQIWANLPASHKMITPRYQEIKSSQIPMVDLDNGAQAKIICGEFMGVKGAVKEIITDPQFWDVLIPANTELSISTPADHNCFIYAYDGSATIDENMVGNRNVLLFAEGDSILIKSAECGFRFLFLSGKPLKEPISWRGPIVMNSAEEISTAFWELEHNNFIKSRG